MKKLLHSFLFLLLLLFYNCEVPLHDNFVEIEPLPMETPFSVKLDTESANDGELKLIKGLSIPYEISTPNAQFISASFYIGDILIHETGTTSGQFYIDDNTPEKFQMNCIIKAKPKEPGNSIRDQITEETYSYIGEIKWNASIVIPELQFYQNPGDVTLETITIRWKFNLPDCYFEIINDGEVVTSKTEETSITVPTPAFGSRERSLRVYAYNRKGETLFPYTTNEYYYQGPGILLKEYQMRSLYSPYSNTLYACQYGDITSYSIPKLTAINEFNEDLNNGTPVTVAPNSDKVAINYDGYLRIFSNQYLSHNVKAYYPDITSYRPRQFILTSDDKLAIYYDILSKVFLYNTNNGELEESISLKTDIPSNYHPALWESKISEQYLCIPLQGNKEIAIFPLLKFKAGEFILYQQPYRELSFYPNHPDKLIITQDDKIVVMDCKNGQIIHSVPKEWEWTFCNIDPKTGNFLFQSNSYLFVLSENGEELFKLPNATYGLQLNNNIITSQYGNALNIEPYLKKK